MRKPLDQKANGTAALAGFVTRLQAGLSNGRFCCVDQTITKACWCGLGILLGSCVVLDQPLYQGNRDVLTGAITLRDEDARGDLRVQRLDVGIFALFDPIPIGRCAPSGPPGEITCGRRQGTSLQTCPTTSAGLQFSEESPDSHVQTVPDLEISVTNDY